MGVPEPSKMSATSPMKRPEAAATELPRVFAGRRRLTLGRLVLNGLAQAGAAAGTALLVQTTFDRLLGGGSAATVGALLPFAGLLALAALGTGFLRAQERVDAERLGQGYVHALRMDLFGRLSALAPRALERRSQGAVMLRFVGDLSAVKQWVSLGLARLLVAATFVIGAVAALAWVNVMLAGAVGSVVALGALAAFLGGRPLRERSREASRHRARMAANVNEKVASIGVVQLYGQTGREGRRMGRQSRKLRSAMLARARVIGFLRGVAETTGALASAAVLLAGAVEVGAGRATPGTVVAAMAIVGLLVAPLRDLGRVQEYWHNSRVSLEKLRSFAETPTQLTDKPGAADLAPGPGRVELRDVELAGSLFGVSAVVEPGSVVALVGPNGAGKSSLFAVLARLIDPDAGSVWLDGQDLAERNLDSVRGAVTMAGPDLPLLRGSVRDNLLYRWPDAPEEELDRVRELCALDGLLAELPDGLETKIRDGGKNLSAGQRQRIALARALVGSPRVLLLDEADANLDSDARGVVERIVREGRGERTVIVISHRPEVLEWADTTWRMESGQLSVSPSPAHV